MPQLSMRRRVPCRSISVATTSFLRLNTGLSLPCPGLIKGRPMTLCRCQTIRLLKWKEDGARETGATRAKALISTAKAGLEARTCERQTLLLGKHLDRVMWGE